MKTLSNLSKRVRLASNKRWSIVITSAMLVATAAFTWAAPPWSPPVALSKSAINSESPAVAVNDSGATAAIWARQQNSTFVIEASVNLTGTWTRAVALTSRNQGGVEPDIAIDNNGLVTAVWSGGTTVMSSTLLANGTWSTPVALAPAGIAVTMPQIVADAAGNVTAMWLRYNAGGAPLFETADRPVGGNWTAPVTLAAMVPQDFQLVTNPAGDMAVVWDVGSFVSSDTVYFSERHFGDTWSAPYVLAPAAYRQGGGRIAIDATGNVTAGWRTNTVINTADKPANAVWGATQALYTSSTVSDYPTLAKTPGGDDMAAWITYVSVGGGYNYQIRTAVRPLGGAWGTPQLLTSNKEYDLDLHAGTTTGGTFVLTWVDNNTFAFKSSTRNASTPWSALNVITRGEFGTNLAVADHTAVAIWLGGSFRTMASTMPVNP